MPAESSVRTGGAAWSIEDIPYGALVPGQQVPVGGRAGSVGPAGAHEPHRVAFYLYELASEFHAQWTRGKDSPHLRFIIQSNPRLTAARLALVQGVAIVLASGLSLLGVGAPEEMR